MATLYSPPLSPAQWRNSHSLNKQPSADTLSSIRPSRSKVPSMSSPPPTKSRFNISSVIRFGMKSKKNRASDIIQDPPEHLYTIPIPVPVSRLHKDLDMSLDPAPSNPRFSRGLSSISGTSYASTDGPLTPTDDLRVSSYYHHSLMSLSDTANKSSPVTRPSPFYANDKRYSASSDKSLGRRIKERLNDDHRSGTSNRISKLPDSATISSPRHANNVDKLEIVRERSLTMPSSHVTRSSVLADMSSDKLHFRAEANHQEMLKTPLLSPVSFQHPFVMAEAIPATLLDAHASAHPRKMSDYSSHGSFRTTMSSLSRTPTVLSTSTSRSAPAASNLNFTSPIKNRFMRGSVATYSSGPPPLSTQSSVSSLKAVATQQSKLTRVPTVIRSGSSPDSVSPRNDSPHPPPTTSLPPTPVELGSDGLLPDTRSLPSSSRRVPSGSAPISSARLSPAASTSPSFTTVKTPSENQHLTPTTSRPVISGSTASLSTISSLSFAARPSTYNGSQSDSRSRSASRSGSVSASIPEQGQKEEEEGSQRGNGLPTVSGTGELMSMIDMSEDTEGEESDIEFVDEEDILRNNGVHASQRSSGSVSKTNLTSESSNSTQLGNQGLSKSTSFVRALTSSTVVNALCKQRSFHHSPPSGSSSVPHSVTATASTSAQVSSLYSSLSTSSPPDSTQSSLNPQTNSLTRSHPSSSSYHGSHTFSSAATNSDPNQAQNSNLTQLQSQQQPHQSQGPLPRKSSVRALRHLNSLDPGMPGDGNGNIKATTTNGVSSPANIANSASGVNVNCTMRAVGPGSNTSDTNGMADKFGSLRVGAISPPSRTASPRASLAFSTTGRSPATSIHSLQLQLQSSEDAVRAGEVPAASSVEKRKFYESRREREKKSDMNGLLSTVAEPSDHNDVHHAFPSRSETRVVPRSHANDNNRDNASTQLPSPKLDFAQPVLTQEEISRIGDEDTLSFRRRTKSSWGSGSASIANTYISVESANPPSNSRFRSPGLMRHAISSSDLYNRANQRDGLLVVVRNEFNDGNPDFTSLPPPPRKTKVNGFSSSSGVNSLGMETGRSRGRKNSEEKKDRDKSRKSSRSKSKSKSKGDENVLDDSEPSFLDMGGSGRNVRLTFEGDKEVVGDGEYTSTIGLSPPKHRVSSGRHNRERDCLHDIVESIQPVYSHAYRHPYGYTEPTYSRTPRDLSLASPSDSLSSPSYRRPVEESFLELRRNHDSILF